MTAEVMCDEAPIRVHITPGPDVELKREPAGDLWCFADRARLPHDWVLLGDSQPSYYDPVWIRECSRCKRDKTEFGSGR